MAHDIGTLLGTLRLMVKPSPELGPEPLHFLTEVRKAVGMTQAQLAERVNELYGDKLTGNDVSRFERSARPWFYRDEETGGPRKNTIRQLTPLYQAKFAAALEVPAWQILRTPGNVRLYRLQDRLDRLTDDEMELAGRLLDAAAQK